MNEIKFLSPCEGQLINIVDFPDEIIAAKDMGDGFGINITNDDILAPFDGVITVVYPTGHAICMQADNGMQIMFHIGVDSYNIQGLNTTYVQVGDYVHTGDKLLTTNIKQLVKKTGNCATAVVFLSGEKIKLLKEKQEVKHLDDKILEIIKD